MESGTNCQKFIGFALPSHRNMWYLAIKCIWICWIWISCLFPNQAIFFGNLFLNHTAHFVAKCFPVCSPKWESKRAIQRQFLRFLWFYLLLFLLLFIVREVVVVVVFCIVSALRILLSYSSVPGSFTTLHMMQHFFPEQVSNVIDVQFQVQVCFRGSGWVQSPTHPYPHSSGLQKVVLGDQFYYYFIL